MQNKLFTEIDNTIIAKIVTDIPSNIEQVEQLTSKQIDEYELQNIRERAKKLFPRYSLIHYF